MSRLLRKTTDPHPTLAPEPSNTYEDGPPPVESDAPIRHRFTRDAVGRLLRKTTDDGISDYAYDAADNLLAIQLHPPQRRTAATEISL
jgi:YD repeat-containing protein